MNAPQAYTYPDKTQLLAYIHRIYGYRYNWHDDMYEIDIVLHGTLEFFRGGEKHILREDDLIIVNPGIGHASYPLEPDTQTLVLRFSARALRDFVSRGSVRQFSFVSDESTRNTTVCRMLRYCAATIVRAGNHGYGTTASRNITRSALGMIAYLMCTELPSQVQKIAGGDITDPDSTLMAEICEFISGNFTQKLMLQDVAERFHYNRTYISTLFKQTMGIGFHEYLTRIRFQRAIYDLGLPDRKLTDIAMDNGFPDLKSFNQLFLDNFQVSPKEYRSRIQRELSAHQLIPDVNHQQMFLDPEDPIYAAKLDSYVNL